MANKTQRAQKNAKKMKGQFQKTHFQTDYQRERDAAKHHKNRKHVSAVEG